MYGSLIIVCFIINEIALGHLLKPSTRISPNVDKDIQGQLEDKVEAAMKSANMFSENGAVDLNDDTLITGEISALIPKKNMYDTKFTKHMKQSAKQQENILRAIENLYKEFQEHDHEHVHLETIRRRTTAITTTTPPPSIAPVYVRPNPVPGNTLPQSPPVYNPQYYQQPNFEYQQHIAEDTRKYGGIQVPPNVMESNTNNVYSPYAPPCPSSPPSLTGPPGPPGSPCPSPFPLSSVSGYMYPPAFPPVPAFPLAPAFPPPPMVLPARSYFEPVVHDHPPINKINEYIKKDRKDFKKWKKYRNKYKNIADSSSGSDSSSSDSDKSMTVDYYDDAILVSAH